MRAAAGLALALVAGCGGANTGDRAVSASGGDGAECAGAVVRDEPGLAAVAGCEVVAGSLSISGEGLSQLRVVALDRLRAVEGDLVIEDNPELVGARFAVLERVAGKIEVANDRALAAFAAPRLARLPGALLFQDCGALIDLDLAALASVDGDLIVSGSRELEVLSLPRLEVVGGALRVEDNEVLADLRLPALKRVGKRIVIELNPMLSTPAATALVQRVETPEAVVQDNAPGP